MKDWNTKEIVAFRWWRSLNPEPTAPERGDRQAIAELRRCSTAADASVLPATFNLVRLLGGEQHEIETIAVCAAILAVVRTDDPTMTVGRRLGTPTHDNRLKFSERLMTRLVRTRSSDEMIPHFRSMVLLCNRTLNVHDLAGALLDWTDGRRQRWLYDYYIGGMPASDDSQPAFEGTMP